MTRNRQTFPARALFVMTASGMAANTLQFAGPMGMRTVASPHSGAFAGTRLRGTIAPGLASEWQLHSASNHALAFVEGLITLLPDAGDDHALEIEPLYMMQASGSVGERHIIKSPAATRYMTIAESGCRTTGKLEARWTAHR